MGTALRGLWINYDNSDISIERSLYGVFIEATPCSMAPGAHSNDHRRLRTAVMNRETTRSATLRPEHWKLKRNSILSIDPAQLLLMTPDWRPFVGSLSSEAKFWHNLETPGI